MEYGIYGHLCMSFLINYDKIRRDSTIRKFRCMISSRFTVASAGRVNGTGDVSLTGAGNVYKTIDGNVGANGTSEGIATGHGASSILSNSYGITGNKSNYLLAKLLLGIHVMQSLMYSIYEHK